MDIPLTSYEKKFSREGCEISLFSIKDSEKEKDITNCDIKV